MVVATGLVTTKKRRSSWGVLAVASSREYRLYLVDLLSRREHVYLFQAGIYWMCLRSNLIYGETFFLWCSMHKTCLSVDTFGEVDRLIRSSADLLK